MSEAEDEPTPLTKTSSLTTIPNKPVKTSVTSLTPWQSRRSASSIHEPQQRSHAPGKWATEDEEGVQYDDSGGGGGVVKRRPLTTASSFDEGQGQQLDPEQARRNSRSRRNRLSANLDAVPSSEPFNPTDAPYVQQPSHRLMDDERREQALRKLEEREKSKQKKSENQQRFSDTTMSPPIPESPTDDGDPKSQSLPRGMDASAMEQQRSKAFSPPPTPAKQQKPKSLYEKYRKLLSKDKKPEPPAEQLGLNQTIGKLVQPTTKIMQPSKNKENQVKVQAQGHPPLQRESSVELDVDAEKAKWMSDHSDGEVKQRPAPNVQRQQVQSPKTVPSSPGTKARMISGDDVRRKMSQDSTKAPGSPQTPRLLSPEPQISRVTSPEPQPSSSASTSEKKSLKTKAKQWSPFKGNTYQKFMGPFSGSDSKTESKPKRGFFNKMGRSENSKSAAEKGQPQMQAQSQGHVVSSPTPSSSSSIDALVSENREQASVLSSPRTMSPADLETDSVFDMSSNAKAAATPIFSAAATSPEPSSPTVTSVAAISIQSKKTEAPQSPVEVSSTKVMIQSKKSEQPNESMLQAPEGVNRGDNTKVLVKQNSGEVPFGTPVERMQLIKKLDQMAPDEKAKVLGKISQLRDKLQTVHQEPQKGKKKQEAKEQNLTEFGTDYLAGKPIKQASPQPPEPVKQKPAVVEQNFGDFGTAYAIKQPTKPATSKAQAPGQAQFVLKSQPQPEPVKLVSVPKPQPSKAEPAEPATPKAQAPGQAQFVSKSHPQPEPVKLVSVQRPQPSKAERSVQDPDPVRLISVPRPAVAKTTVDPTVKNVTQKNQNQQPMKTDLIKPMKMKPVEKAPEIPPVSQQPLQMSTTAKQIPSQQVFKSDSPVLKIEPQRQTVQTQLRIDSPVQAKVQAKVQSPPMLRRQENVQSVHQAIPMEQKLTPASQSALHHRKSEPDASAPSIFVESKEDRIEKMKNMDAEEKLRLMKKIVMLKEKMAQTAKTGDKEDERRATQSPTPIVVESRVRKSDPAIVVSQPGADQRQAPQVQQKKEQEQALQRQRAEEQQRKQMERENLQKQKEVDRLRQLERQQAEDRARQQREAERLQQVEKERERKRQKEAERLKQIEKQREEERIRKQKEAERLRQLEKERAADRERQKEAERLKQIEKQQEEERIRKQKETERLRKLEKHREEERVRQQQDEREREAERVRKQKEAERLQLLEREREAERQRKQREAENLKRQQEAERVRQQQEAEKLRKQKEEEHRRQKEAEQVRKQKKVEHLQQLAKEREAERLQKQKEMEHKRQLEREREAEREAERLQKQKETERLMQIAREKDIERARIQKEKEDERKKLELQKQAEQLRKQKEAEHLQQLAREREKERSNKQKGQQDLEKQREVERKQKELEYLKQLVKEREAELNQKEKEDSLKTSKEFGESEVERQLRVQKEKEVERLMDHNEANRIRQLAIKSDAERVQKQKEIQQNLELKQKQREAERQKLIEQQKEDEILKGIDRQIDLQRRKAEVVKLKSSLKEPGRSQSMRDKSPGRSPSSDERGDKSPGFNFIEARIKQLETSDTNLKKAKSMDEATFEKEAIGAPPSKVKIPSPQTTYLDPFHSREAAPRGSSDSEHLSKVEEEKLSLATAKKHQKPKLKPRTIGSQKFNEKLKEVKSILGEIKGAKKEVRFSDEASSEEKPIPQALRIPDTFSERRKSDPESDPDHLAPPTSRPMSLSPSIKRKLRTYDSGYRPPRLGVDMSEESVSAHDLFTSSESEGEFILPKPVPIINEPDVELPKVKDLKSAFDEEFKPKPVISDSPAPPKPIQISRNLPVSAFEEPPTPEPVQRTVDLSEIKEIVPKVSNKIAQFQKDKHEPRVVMARRYSRDDSDVDIRPRRRAPHISRASAVMRVPPPGQGPPTGARIAPQPVRQAPKGPPPVHSPRRRASDTDLDDMVEANLEFVEDPPTLGTVKIRADPRNEPPDRQRDFDDEDIDFEQEEEDVKMPSVGQLREMFASKPLSSSGSLGVPEDTKLRRLSDGFAYGKEAERKWEGASWPQEGERRDSDVSLSFLDDDGRKRYITREKALDIPGYDAGRHSQDSSPGGGGGRGMQRSATYDVGDSGGGGRAQYGRAYTSDTSPLDSAGFVDLDMKRFGSLRDSDSRRDSNSSDVSRHSNASGRLSPSSAARHGPGSSLRSRRGEPQQLPARPRSFYDNVTPPSDGSMGADRHLSHSASHLGAKGGAAGQRAFGEDLSNRNGSFDSGRGQFPPRADSTGSNRPIRDARMQRDRSSLDSNTSESSKPPTGLEFTPRRAKNFFSRSQEEREPDDVWKRRPRSQVIESSTSSQLPWVKSESQSSSSQLPWLKSDSTSSVGSYDMSTAPGRIDMSKVSPMQQYDSPQYPAMQYSPHSSQYSSQEQYSPYDPQPLQEGYSPASSYGQMASPAGRLDMRRLPHSPASGPPSAPWSPYGQSPAPVGQYEQHTAPGRINMAQVRQSQGSYDPGPPPQQEPDGRTNNTKPKPFLAHTLSSDSTKAIPSSRPQMPLLESQDEKGKASIVSSVVMPTPQQAVVSMATDRTVANATQTTTAVTAKSSIAPAVALSRVVPPAQQTTVTTKPLIRSSSLTSTTTPTTTNELQLYNKSVALFTHSAFIDKPASEESAFTKIQPSITTVSSVTSDAPVLSSASVMSSASAATTPVISSSFSTVPSSVPTAVTDTTLITSSPPTDSVTSSISAVTSSVSAVTSSVSAVTSSVSAVTSSVSAVTSSVSAVTSSVSAVTSSVSAVTSSVSAVTSSVSAVTSSVSAVTSSVSATTASPVNTPPVMMTSNSMTSSKSVTPTNQPKKNKNQVSTFEIEPVQVSKSPVSKSPVLNHQLAATPMKEDSVSPTVAESWEASELHLATSSSSSSSPSKDYSKPLVIDTSEEEDLFLSTEELVGDLDNEGLIKIAEDNALQEALEYVRQKSAELHAETLQQRQESKESKEESGADKEDEKDKEKSDASFEEFSDTTIPTVSEPVYATPVITSSNVVTTTSVSTVAVSKPQDVVMPVIAEPITSETTIDIIPASLKSTTLMHPDDLDLDQENLDLDKAMKKLDQVVNELNLDSAMQTLDEAVQDLDNKREELRDDQLAPPTQSSSARTSATRDDIVQNQIESEQYFNHQASSVSSEKATSSTTSQSTNHTPPPLNNCEPEPEPEPEPRHQKTRHKPVVDRCENQLDFEAARKRRAEMERRRHLLKQDSFSRDSSSPEFDGPMPLPRDSVILRSKYGAMKRRESSSTTSSSEESSPQSPPRSPRVPSPRHSPRVSPMMLRKLKTKMSHSSSSSFSFEHGATHLGVPGARHRMAREQRQRQVNHV